MTRPIVPYRGHGYRQRSRQLVNFRNTMSQLNKWSPFARKHGGGATAKAVRGAKATALVKRKQTSHKAIEHRSGSESFFKLVRKARGLPMKLAMKTSHLSYQQNAGYTNTSSVSLQNQAAVPLFGIADLTVMANNVLTQEYAGATPTGYKTLSVCFDSVFSEFGFQNSENTSVRIIIYDIQLKRDIYQDSLGVTINPSSAWQDGMKSEVSGPTGNECKYYGALPTDSKLFNLYFKIKSRIYVQLAPGQIHYHRVTYKPRKRMNNEIILSANCNGIRGLTHWVMWQFYGQPIENLAGTAGTIEASKLNVVQRLTYKYNYVPTDMVTLTQGAAISTMPQVAIENMDIGATANYAQV